MQKYRRPSLRDWGFALLLAMLGALLGLGINSLSPRGFDLSLAAGQVASQNLP